jgi:hypothetical protein
VALLLQESGDCGRVDTAGHGNGDEAALCFGALGESLELDRRIHGDNLIVADSTGARRSSGFFSTQRSQSAQRKKGEEEN